MQNLDICAASMTIYRVTPAVTQSLVFCDFTEGRPLFCLFFIPLEDFHSFGDVTIAGEGLQILTFARHIWLLSSEDSLAFHIYSETGHPFITVISEDPWHSHLYCVILFIKLFDYLSVFKSDKNLQHDWRLWSLNCL